jgi:hypothetical protein
MFIQVPIFPHYGSDSLVALISMHAKQVQLFSSGCKPKLCKAIRMKSATKLVGQTFEKRKSPTGIVLLSTSVYVKIDAP